MKSANGRGTLFLLASGLALTVACSFVQKASVDLWGGAQPEAESSEPVEGETAAGGDAAPFAGAAVQAPELDPQEQIALAYPRLEPEYFGASRAVQGAVSEWPEMRYLGESAQIDDVSVTPTEIRIVAGTDVPMFYHIEEDEMRPAPDGEPMQLQGSRLVQPGVYIPPNASLVMVRLTMDPSVGRWVGPGTYECPEEESGSPTSFTLGYPDLGEVAVHIGQDGYWFGEYQGIGRGCPGDGWLYFFVPGQGLDPSLLWLEYVAGDGLVFWTMAERP